MKRLAVFVVSLVFALILGIQNVGARVQKSFMTRLPQKTSEQKVFVENFRALKYTEALKQWDLAYGETRFARSDNGKGLYNWLLFQSGLELTAIEQLFSTANPKKMHPGLRSLWSETLPLNHRIWGLAHIKWKRSWNKVFPDVAAIGFPIFPAYRVKTAKKLKILRKELKDNWLDPHQREWILWQTALWETLHNQSQRALKHLEQLKAMERSRISADDIALAEGRIHYQTKNYKASIRSFNRIPKTSDLWLGSLEEKAYAYARNGQYDKALAQLKTLLAPLFKAQVGPEPFFLASYLNLKICDYPRVFKVTESFKKRLRDRTQALQGLVKTGSSKSASQLFQIAMKSGVSWKALGSQNHFLPRNYDQDRYLKQHLNRAQASKSEALKLKGPLASLADSEELTEKVQQRSDSARKETFARLIYLAKRDLKEMSTMLQKLHIVEAESIQRLYGPQKVAGQTGKSWGTSDPNQLVFPVSDEIWIDELDHYQVNAKDCPSKGGNVL